MTKYPELNRHGLTDYHHQKLCYPYTSVPAFKFWEPYVPSDNPILDPMRTWQDGRCGLCGFRFPLVVDHCHDTGLIRGQLCRSCNVTEGVGNGHNLDQWRGGVTVAAEMGIKEMYVNAFGRTPRRAKVTDADLDAVAEALAGGDSPVEAEPYDAEAIEAAIIEMNRRSNEQRERARLEQVKRKIASAVMW